MTALKEYQRLEATGLWRAAPQAQRREVVVSMGDATLTITDMQDRALAHWSLAAVARANPGALPALFYPDGDPDEQLELDEDAAEMIAAIDKLLRAIARRRPRPGRLRLGVVLTTAAVIAALGVFWLPDAMRAHTLTVVPDAKRQELDGTLRRVMQRVTGPACADPAGVAALSRLAARLAPQGARPPELVVVRTGPRDALALPGGTVLLNAALVEDHEDPDVVAGHILAAQARAATSDPLDRLLAWGGMRASFRLLTTGALPDDLLARYAETLPAAAPVVVSDDALLARFAAAGVRSTPYAYALDVTGETVLPLIEGDPFGASAAPEVVLNDADWLRLQAICGN